MWLSGIIVLCLAACNSEEGNEEVKHPSFVVVNAYYTRADNRNLVLPDQGSKVFLYLHDVYTDYMEYNYDKETGVFSTEADTIRPIESGTTDEKGELIMDIRPLNLFQKPCMIIFVSNSYKRVSMDVLPVVTPWETYEMTITSNP
jgi:hypothetical protein